MVFKPNPPREQIADSPEQLLQMLPRGKRAATSLWSHQADVLRDYMARFQKSGDVAIELPTGTGKTLPGLLIAEWRRRKNRGRVVYACPTVQLVRQVVRVAERQSVPVVDLSGSSKYWSASDEAAFEGGRAIAVATYSAIFNVNPRLRDIDLLIFDDAHAGEQYVASAYTVEISRRDDPDVYEDVIEAIRPALSKERHHELTMTAPGVAGRRALDVVFPALYDSQIPSLDHALSKLASGSREAFHYSAIAGHLTACAVYLSWDTISIRPLTPPTFENVSFSNAKQRLYLSATLGASGELERAFGRPTIKRLALPENAGRPTSGRRFIVFPFLASGIDSLELTKRIVEVAGKAIEPELPPLEPGALPILLWPEWASPLDVGAAVTDEALRRALSAAVSAVGQAGPEHPRRADTTKMSSGRFQELGRSLGRLLRPQMLGDESTATTLIHCITELAILLRRVPSRIDYAARLRLPWQEILSHEHWLMICDVAGHHPGSTSRLRNAQRYTFQRLTLAPSRLLPEHLAIGRHRQDAAEYSAFRRGVTEELQNALDSHVANVLRDLGINEPVMWAPSRRQATLAAPGRELGDIDWPILHALRQRGSTDSRLAKELHRSPRHVRWAGDLRPHQATANAVKLDRVSFTDPGVEPNPPRATF